MNVCIKVKYSSKEFADFQITKTIKKKDGLKLLSYLCKCGSWHITSKKPHSEVIKELEEQIECLKQDVEDLTISNQEIKESLIKQIKKNVDQKAEIDILQRFKNVNKNTYETPDLKQLKTKVNRLEEKVRNQRDQINKLLDTLNKVK